MQSLISTGKTKMPNCTLAPSNTRKKTCFSMVSVGGDHCIEFFTERNSVKTHPL